jgi:uncharacterized Zn-binding protein involved in type VI secretion
MFPVARLTDKHACPICGPNMIASGGISTADNLPIARVGDTTACGAVILTGSSMATEGGMPVAYLGSTTSHGGVIVTGSPFHTVMP